MILYPLVPRVGEYNIGKVKEGKRMGRIREVERMKGVRRVEEAIGEIR